MIKDWNKLANELSARVGDVRAGAPEVMQGFSAMAKAATKDGALSEKTRS